MKNKGISLIVLIITIVVIIILATAIIVNIAKTNIIENANKAVDSHQLSNAKEKLNVNFMDFLAKNKDKSLDDLKSHMSTITGYSATKLENNSSEYTKLKELYNIQGNVIKISDEEFKYTFLVDENFSVMGPIYSDVEVIYEVLSTDNNMHNILISVSNIQGIEKITYPNGEVIEYNLENNVEFEYTVVSSTEYTFNIKTYNEDERNFKIIVDGDNVDIDIVANTYPVICSDGVYQKCFATINNESGEYYYSVDDGKTWNLYEGTFYLAGDTNLKVKIQVNSQVSQIVSKKITVSLASDALGKNAWDGILTSYIEGYRAYGDGYNFVENSGYMYVDESMVNRSYNIKYACTISSDPTGVVAITYYNKDGGTIGSSVSLTGNYNSATKTLTIPEGTDKIYFRMYFSKKGYSGGRGYAQIYEITPVS